MYEIDKCIRIRHIANSNSNTNSSLFFELQNDSNNREYFNRIGREALKTVEMDHG